MRTWVYVCGLTIMGQGMNQASTVLVEVVVGFDGGRHIIDRATRAFFSRASVTAGPYPGGAM